MAKEKAVMVRTEVYKETSVNTDLDTFLATLTALKTNPEAKYEVDISVTHEWGSDYGEITVTEVRPETATERLERKKKARFEKAQQKKAELAEFERLREKLGK